MGEVEVHALGGLDMELYRGEFVVLLGPSGSGKSTLLNILGGLDVPTAGQVFYEQQKLTNYSEAALTRYRRHSVGFVFQFYNLIPSLTAQENVALITEMATEPMTPRRRNSIQPRRFTNPAWKNSASPVSEWRSPNSNTNRHRPLWGR